MLEENSVAVVMPALLKATRDDDKEVKLFFFSCIAYLCEVVKGSEAVVQFNGVHELLRYLQLAMQGGYTSSLDDETSSFVLR